MISNEDILLYRQLQKSPIFFVEKMWGLKPQPVKSDRVEVVEGLVKDGRFEEVTELDFEPFIRTKHLTWQQFLILKAVENSLIFKGKRRISVRSGHGIGKTTVLSWLVIWFLFCHKDAQIPCTAPTTEQMHDILWKELSIWIQKMPKELQGKFDWTTGYLRITENPTTWFARAKTARKEAPEALAGVHGEYVMFVIDEASGVPNEIFNTAEGALTGENIIVIMISNPTRLLGYFYDSHHSDRNNWQTLAFNSEQSPIVDHRFVDRIIDKNGSDSDEYKIRVKGEFPREDAVDDKGYIPLLLEEDIRKTPDQRFIGWKKMGVDPSGEGKNKTVWVVRDNFRAKIVAEEQVSNEKTIALKTANLMDYFQIFDRNVVVDNFGKGANVAQELALMGRRVKAVNVGEAPENDTIYMNKRAEVYDRVKKWLRTGGELTQTDKWNELLRIKIRRELNGKMKIMSKLEMQKEGIPSPDYADALSLTFYEDDRIANTKRQNDFLITKKTSLLDPNKRVAASLY